MISLVSDDKSGKSCSHVDGLTQEEVHLSEKRWKARRKMFKDHTVAESREQYSKLNKKVKRAVKKAKLKNFDQRHDSHNLFNKTVKELEGKPKTQLTVLKDDNG